jgi:hypothetical protein
MGSTASHLGRFTASTAKFEAAAAFDTKWTERKGIKNVMPTRAVCIVV